MVKITEQLLSRKMLLLGESGAISGKCSAVNVFCPCTTKYLTNWKTNGVENQQIATSWLIQGQKIEKHEYPKRILNQIFYLNNSNED